MADIGATPRGFETSIDSMSDNDNSSEDSSSSTFSSIDSSSSTDSAKSFSFLNCLGTQAKIASAMSGRRGKTKERDGPLEIEKSKASLLYDKEGRTYVDCISGVSHVGHCHPKIVNVFQKQLGSMGTGHISTTPRHIWDNVQTRTAMEKEPLLKQSMLTNFDSKGMNSYANSDHNPPQRSHSRLTNRLLKTLDSPYNLQTALTFTSGSQANDMAIQLARAYTGNHDVIIFEESFHGGLSTGADMSAKMMVKIDNGKDEDRSQSPDLAQMCKKPKLDSFQVDLSDAISYEEDYDDSNPRSDTTSTTSSTPQNLHLEGTDNDENRWPGISAPLYKDKPDWVHVLPVPDLTRGYYSNDEPSVAIEKYINDAKTIINTHIRRGRRIACLLSEPAFTFYNGTIPSTPYFEKISSYVREIGGLVIMDEVQSGLGRIGHHWWGFQVHKMEPDIVTAGKALNNGHPISFLFTSHKILSSLGGQSLLDVHRPTPIQEALGNCVLDIMLEERLLDNCKDVGNFIESSMQRLMSKYSCISSIHGKGLMFGIEIASSKTEDDKNQRPNSKMAAAIRNRLREKQVIVAVEGKYRNVVYIIPPLCFSKHNANTFIEALDDVVNDLVKEEILEMPLSKPEPTFMPANRSRKRNALGMHPLHPVNRGMMRKPFFRPTVTTDDESVTSFSFWNREGSGTGQEDEEDNNQPNNQEKNNLSQGQYHFFSMRDTSSARDGGITLGDVMGDQLLDSTMEDEKGGALSMDNVSSMMRSPVADASNEGYGSYDELD